MQRPSNIPSIKISKSVKPKNGNVKYVRVKFVKINLDKHYFYHNVNFVFYYHYFYNLIENAEKKSADSNLMLP